MTETKLITKFSIGDTVFRINEDTVRKIVKCATCEESGKITIAAEEFICPKCHGQSAHAVYVGNKWYVSRYGDQLTIGKVSASVSIHPESDYDEGVRYMCHETGVGSGSVHHERDLFATLAEAQAECDRRNGGVDYEDTGTLKPALY